MTARLLERERHGGDDAGEDGLRRLDAGDRDLLVRVQEELHNHHRVVPLLDRLPVGTRVRILPNHACITAAAYDRYYVVDSDLDGGRSVVEIYDRINGW